MVFLVRSNLRQLIVALALLSTLVAVLNMFVSSVKVQRQALIDNTFQSNEAYASKLAESTQFFIENTQLELAHSAKKIAENWSNIDFLQQESLNLSEQNNTFSSVVLVNAQGFVLAGSANITALIGTQLQTLGSEQSLNERKPLVSKAYQSTLQNLVVMITSPIFAKDGTYLGYIGGTIYLKEKNVLSHLLGNHHYQDGSYIYVINQQKQLLYHPNEDRLGAYRQLTGG